ncbi:MAG: Ig-like domain repeat protein [Terracidiphilus sp.]|nr:Ig-like domain repeat protein [Terracidiphilus sp.]
MSGSSQSDTASSSFLVASSFSLGYAPSSVATGDLRQAGKQDLVTADYNSGKITVFLGTGKGSFASGAAYAAGPHPSFVAVADINGDGRPDVLVANETEGTISVLLGNGDGTLQALQSYAAGVNPSYIVTGDFSGNGKTDVAAAGKSGNLLAVLPNDGSGNLQKPILYSLSKTPSALAAADFNSDGHADLALANADGTVSILLGQGGGVFSPLSDISAAAGELSSIVAGDFNKDGKSDLAVTQANSTALTVLLGAGNGAFLPGVAYSVGNNPVDLIAADVNGDQVLDLIAVNQSANTFSVLLGNGDGSFASSVDFVAGNTPIAAVAADFNGDGHMDLAIANSQGQSISLSLGKGDGTFRSARSYKAGLQRKAIAAGDLNGDGRSDLVVANFCGHDSSCSSNGSVAVFLASQDGSYTQAATYALGSGPVAVALADLNGDKKLDLIALNRNDKTLTIMPGNGDGTLGQAQSFTLTNHPRALFVGDFNGDSKADVAIVSDCGQRACTQAGSLDIWLSNGDGTLTESTSYPVGYSPVSITGGDLRGTGHIDLIVANACGEDSTCQSQGSASVFFGEGKAKFALSNEVNIGSAPSAIALGKLSGSDLNLVVAQRSSDQIAVLAGDGKGGFGASATYAVGSAPSALVVADLNGDGLDDVAVANFAASTVSVLNGTAKGTLQPAVTYTVGTGPESIAVVKTSTGSVSSLVTANGNSGASPMGSDISLLIRTQPMTQSNVASFTLTINPPSSSVDQQVMLTATAIGSGATPTGNVVFFYSGTPQVALADCGGVSGIALDGAGIATCITQLLPFGSSTPVEADYTGDSSYSTATATATPSVGRAATTTTVQSANTSTNVDDSVTFTATISPSMYPMPSPVTDVVPISGTVTFRDNGSAIIGCDAQTVNFNTGSGTATATCVTSALTAGVHSSINAVYAGDTNYTSSTSSDQQKTVSALAATIGITASPSSSTSVNDTVTFTAALAATHLTPVVPAGSVSFRVNGNPSSDCPDKTVNSSGQATCITNRLIASSDSIVAIYAGDSNYTVAASGTTTQTVAKASSTITVDSTPKTVSHWTADQPVTLTAAVTASSGTAYVPFSGSVTFTDDAGSIVGCSSAVAVNTSTGVASCTATALSAGFHSIVATYASDTNYNGSTSSTLNNQVDKASTTTTLASGNNNSAVNDSVTFTATVTPSPVPSVSNELAISGSVAFYVDGSSTPISGCSAQTASYSTSTGQATATCTTAALTAAGSPHAITATYAGDSNYNGSNNAANPVPQTVNALAATLGVTASPISSKVNDAVTFTAQLAGVTMTPVVPAGTVSFTVNGSASPDCPAKTVDASGKATCTTSRLVTPSDTIAATYAGDANFTVATAGSATQTVSKTTPSVSLASSGPSHVNDSVTLTATLSGSVTPVAPTGTVSFTSNGNQITGCAAQPVDATTHVATCTTTSLIVGSDAIGATYAGDANFATAGATPISQSVSKQTPTVAVSSPGPSTVNDSVTFTATLSGTFTPLSPTGSVAFTLNGNPIAACSAQIVDATTHLATCSVNTLVAPSDAIGATYAGDSNFATAGAAPFTQSVSKLTPTVTLSTSPNPSTVNSSVTLTATLSGTFTPNSPTGTVGFTSNGNPIASCTAQAVDTTTHKATCVTSALVATSDAIGATYAGDTNFATADASPITQTVNALAATLGLTVSPSNSTYYNDTVTFTAQFSSASYSPVVPSGTVNFTSNGNPITGCTAQAVDTTTHKATCTTTSLLAGSDTIGAAYTGDNNFTVSAPATVTQTVMARTTTAAASASLYYSPSSQAAPLSATVTSSAGTVNAGTVTFTLLNGSTVIGAPVTSGTVTSGAAAASYTLPAGLNAGAYTIQAVYNAANYFVTSTDSSHALTVQKLTPVITWNTPATIIYGTALSTAQLNATASVPGTYVYTPAIGNVPAVGSNTLSVTFTPNDSVNYTTATAIVTLQVNNPVPVMGSMTPVFTAAGGTAFSLAVTGSGFVANSTVYWGTTALTTTYGSSTQLTAQVPASLTATAGTATITVQTPTPGGGTSSSLQFEVDSAASTTTTPPSFTTVTATVTAGASASYPVTLPSTATATSVTCLNLPAGATCSYSATTKAITITTSSTTPAGTYLITVVFSETVPGAATALVLLPLLLLPLAIARRKWTAGSIGLMACLGFVLMVAAASIGCGGSSATHQVTSSGTVSLIVK